MADKGRYGPIVTIQNCCPAIKIKSCMLEDRVEGRIDFIDVEFVVCADKKIRAEYFPEVGWAEVETFCAPSDIHEQLD
jgi:hypothetical protein